MLFRSKGGMALPPDAAGACEARANTLADTVRQVYGADVALVMDGYCIPEGNGMKTASFIIVDADGKRDLRALDFPGRPQQYIRRAITFAVAHLMDRLKGPAED